MVLEYNFEGFNEMIKGFDEWKRSYWGQLKEEWVRIWEEAANFARNKNVGEVKTSVTGGRTEKWEPFELKMTANAPGIVTTEFGRERFAPKKEDETDPKERKTPMSDYLIPSIIIGSLIMSASLALFWEETEWMYDLEEKMLIE